MPKSFISDMDGVVYKGNQLVPGADEFVEKLKRGGHKFLFLTNNSRHTPLDLRRKMKDLGIELEENTYTSALATAAFKHANQRACLCHRGCWFDQSPHDVGYPITERNPDYVRWGETLSNFEQIQKAIFFWKGVPADIPNPDLTGVTEHGLCYLRLDGPH